MTTATPPAYADTAQEKFSDGIAAFQKEDYPAALAAFEESYQLAPKASVLFNIGMCRRALYRYADAIAAFEEFIADAGDAKPELAAEARAQVGEMEKLVGGIALDGAPDGAEVSIDAAKIATAPLSKPLRVDPGRHIVTIALEGYETLTIEANVPSGAAIRVAAELTKNPAPALPVTATPAPRPAPASDPTLAPEPMVAPTAGPPPTRKPAPYYDSRKIRAAGWTVALLGVTAVGLGVGFSLEYNADVDDANVAAAHYESVGGTPNDKAAYDDIKDNQLPADKAGIVVGYAVGGAMVVTGIALLAAGYAKKSGAKEVAVTPAPTGLRVSF